MTNKIIYTVNIYNTQNEIIYSTDFYDKKEAEIYISKNDLGGEDWHRVELKSNNIFENGKFTETTTFFDGWTLPEAERKLIIDFAEADSGCNIFSEYVYDVGRRIDVTNAIEYGCDEEEIEENPELIKVKAILEKAFEAGVDIITFYQ